MEAFLGLVAVIEEPPCEPVIREDPDDDRILACALAAKAAFIVSGDTHLLHLRNYAGIRIVSPAQFLRIR